MKLGEVLSSRVADATADLMAKTAVGVLRFQDEVNHQIAGLEIASLVIAAGFSRNERVKQRNTTSGRRGRRNAAQSVMGTDHQQGIRAVFRDYPNQVMAALELPETTEVAMAFHSQARKTPPGQKPDPMVPMAERELGVIEYDPDDRRITAFQKNLGVEIHPKPAVNQNGGPLAVWDWVRREREDGDGRKLTGTLASPDIDENGQLVYRADWRRVNIPDISGAVARAGLRAMTEALGEDLSSRRTTGIIAALDPIAETTGIYISPDRLEDIFSLARTNPRLSPGGVVETWMEKHSPKIDLSHPSTRVMRKNRWIGKLWRRKQPIRVTRVRPRLSLTTELADLAREHRFLIAGLIGVAGSSIPFHSVLAGGLLQEGVELPGWLTKDVIDYLISGSVAGLVGGLLAAGWEKLLGKPMVWGVDKESGKISSGAIIPPNTKEIMGNGVEGLIPGFAAGILLRAISENPLTVAAGIAAWWLLDKTYRLPIDTSSIRMPNGKGLSVAQFFKIYWQTWRASRGGEGGQGEAE